MLTNLLAGVYSRRPILAPATRTTEPALPRLSPRSRGAMSTPRRPPAPSPPLATPGLSSSRPSGPGLPEEVGQLGEVLAPVLRSDIDWPAVEAEYEASRVCVIDDLLSQQARDCVRLLLSAPAAGMPATWLSVGLTLPGGATFGTFFPVAGWAPWWLPTALTVLWGARGGPRCPIASSEACASCSAFLPPKTRPLLESFSSVRR